MAQPICDPQSVDPGSAVVRARRLVLVLLGTLLLVGACARLPEAGEFRVGMTRTELVDRFGPPARTQTMRRTGQVVFGPIEEFWSKVPQGSTVELWGYRVADGTVELYFIDGSLQAQGSGFAPTGAVY